MKRLFLLSIVLIGMVSIAIVSQAQNIEFENLTKFYTFDGNYQNGMVGKELPKKLKVKVTYSLSGNPRAGVSVDFRVTHGSGTVSTHATSRTGLTNTDSQGIATATVTAGNATGYLTVNAYAVDLNNREKKVAQFTSNIFEPVTRKLVTNGTGTLNVWKKFKGENVPAGVPNIIDWSYAGYKNGEEGIPDSFALPYYNVVDYGAIPNDGQSDTQAIRDTIIAASNGGIVFFPPGLYDVITDGEIATSILIEGDNIIIRGSGAAGADRGGTTIKMHNRLETNRGLFKTVWLGGGSASVTTVKGTFPRFTKHFDVEDVSSLIGKRFVNITAENLTGNDYDVHSSRPVNVQRSISNLRDGVDIYEIHEIDRIEGDRIYVKAPVLTPLNSNYEVKSRNLYVGLGFEDIQIDGNLHEDFVHGETLGRRGVELNHSAHSWIRRCRFTNIVGAHNFVHTYCNTAHSIIVDGNTGHDAGKIAFSTYCLTALTEEYKNGLNWHGVTVANQSVGTVYWGIGGTIDGPDAHGDMPRYTLWDNYFSILHNSSSGTGWNQPHHLDGYLRWNNETQDRGIFDLWGDGYYHFTQSIFVGYKAINGGQLIDTTYVESPGTHVRPNSLYIAQLERRLGYIPAWIDKVKEDYENFFAQIYSTTKPNIEGPINIVPVFDDVSTALEVDENTAANTNIGDPFTATDADPRDTLSYRLEGSDASVFTIDSSTGQIKTSGSLNHELKNSYAINVKVFDGVAETTLAITINVGDVNEAPTFIRARSGFTASHLYLYTGETNVVGKLISDPISATDVDADDELTYSLLSHGGVDPFFANQYKLFQIDAETGQLKTKAAILYVDRDEANYLMKVRVTDSGGLYETITVRVTIEDKSAPVFTAGSSKIVLEITETDEIGTNVGDPIVATDDDNDPITYGLEQVNIFNQGEHESFNIDPDTGQLTTKKKIDYGVQSRYTVRVTATDIEKFVAKVVVEINITSTPPLSGRTQQVQDGIVAELVAMGVEGVTTATDVTKDHLSTIQYLNIDDKSIKKLKSGDFDGLTSVVKLALDNNSLRTLPNGIFSGLSSLITIRLDNNKFVRLPKHVFDELSSLQQVYLHNNNLISLRRNVFANNPDLTHIYLGNNGIASLRFNPFSGLSSLRTLNLSGNKLKTLDDDLFEGLASLTALFLDNNKLTVIPDGIFEGLSLDSHLRIEGNITDPILLSIELEKVGQDQFKVVIPAGATFDINVPITVTDGFIAGGRTSVAMSSGDIESDPISVVRNTGAVNAVMVYVGELPGLPSEHSGYAFSKSDEPLIVVPAIVGAPSRKPGTTELLANYPNPFNPRTWIPYQLARTSNLSITIYDIHGNVVRELALGHQLAGYYVSRSRAAYWDGRNETGEPVSTGIYFYRFKTGDISTVRKMVIMK